MQQIMMKNKQEAYRRQGVLTASPIELIIMLYDGLKKDIALGKRAIIRKDAEASHRYLMKAQAIVEELMRCLDMNAEISKDLMRLYDFMLYTLETANIKKDVSDLDALLEIVGTLRDTWQEVSNTQKVHFDYDAEELSVGEA